MTALGGYPLYDMSCVYFTLRNSETGGIQKFAPMNWLGPMSFLRGGAGQP